MDRLLNVPRDPMPGASAKLHVRRVIKAGMAAFFSGDNASPYAPGSEEAEWWAFGRELAKDNWAEFTRR